MFKQKKLWIFCLVILIIYSINEILIYMFIDDAKQNFFIHLIEGPFALLIIGLFLSNIFAKRNHYITSKEEEKERLHTLINSMVDVVIFKDGEGRYIEANSFGLKLFQLEHVDYKGKTNEELAEYTTFYADAFRSCTASDEQIWDSKTIGHVEEFIPMPDGTTRTFDTIKVPLFNEDGSRKGLVLIGRDITERVQTQELMCAKEQRYKSLFHYNPEPIMMMDLTGQITTINPRFEAITGYSSKELLGTMFLNLDFEQTKDLKESFNFVLENHQGIISGEVLLATKHGKKVILICTLVPILINNDLVGVINYATDVTQIRETQKQLKNSEKLSIVGELAASVAHEVRNPLTSLKGFVQLLKGRDHEYENYYSIMLSELDRINLIVSELLVIAKPQNIPFKQHQIVELLNDVKSLLEAEANFYSNKIYLTVKEPIPLLYCEANQIKQVFINVIKNALEAKSNHVWITIEQVEKQIVITIKDDGCGIETERLKHLGEPFYSSKERGTGLGLTVSYRIIEAHKGKVVVESKVSQGTTIQIKLPINN